MNHFRYIEFNITEEPITDNIFDDSGTSKVLWDDYNTTFDRLITTGQFKTNDESYFGNFYYCSDTINDRTIKSFIYCIKDFKYRI
jgi:hypothetical protein